MNHNTRFPYGALLLILCICGSGGGADVSRGGGNEVIKLKLRELMFPLSPWDRG